jgi:hypothetical protein
MNPDLIYLFVGELFLILFLYRFVFRQMIVTHWEEKIAEDNWLVINLEPVIDEIEERMHEKLQDFQSSFFGSVGKMTAKAKELDPMNGIRKAAKDGDWTSMLVEYAANKAGIGGVLGQINPQTSQKEPKINAKPPLPKSIKHDLLHK